MLSIKIDDIPADPKLITSNLLYEDIPKVFSDEEIYNLDDVKDLNDLEMKKLGDLIDKYESMYQIDPNLTTKNLNTLSINYGRILLHEWFMFWFPHYFEKYADTIETLFLKDEFIPITWRFYIALMVSKPSLIV